MSPGQRDRAARELGLAADALRAAAALLDMGLVLDAVSRMYYAVFHASRAALLVRDKHAKTHSGQATVFTATFGPAPLISRLLELRIDADYRPEDFSETGSGVRDLLAEARGFVERCRALVDNEVAGGVNDPDPLPDL